MHRDRIYADLVTGKSNDAFAYELGWILGRGCNDEVARLQFGESLGQTFKDDNISCHV